MILFFDTETNGLPIDWRAQMSQVDNWPRVIQLAWALTDLKGEIITQKEILIKPDGWEIPAEEFWINNGFTQANSLAKGYPIMNALAQFVLDLAQADFLVSHNLEFDYNVLGAEMLRAKIIGKRCTKICTKEASTQYCAIPFDGQRAYMSKVSGRYKWPKLEELHLKLFGRDFEDKHSAGGDVAALKNCFFELVARGVIVLETKTVAQ